MIFIDIFQVRYLPFVNEEKSFQVLMTEPFNRFLAFQFILLLKYPTVWCARFPEIIHI